MSQPLLPMGMKTPVSMRDPCGGARRPIWRAIDWLLQTAESPAASWPLRCPNRGQNYPPAFRALCDGRT